MRTSGQFQTVALASQFAGAAIDERGRRPGDPKPPPGLAKAPARQFHYERAEQSLATESRRLTHATGFHTLSLARRKYLSFRVCRQAHENLWRSS